MSEYIETKRRLDGRVQSFKTRALLVTPPRLAVIRFDFTGSYSQAGGFDIPPGSFTMGFFWRDRTYNLYHMVTGDGLVLADRFDVVESVRIRREGLDYTDLLLDLWVSPLGEARFEDEEEVREYEERHLLTERQMRTIQRTGRYLARNHRAVVHAALAEFERLSGTGAYAGG